MEPSQKSYLNCIYLADSKALSASMHLYSMMGTSGWSHNCCYTVLAASESSSDVVVPATLQSPPDPVFSAPLSSPARLQCDVDPVSALVHFCSTPSPVPSLSISPAPTLDAAASPASQKSVVAEIVERLSAVAQQKQLEFNVSTLSVCPRRICSHTDLWGDSSCA